MKILNLDGLRHLVNNIKSLVNTSAENTLISSKAYTNENVELIKNQILDPDNYGISETGGVTVVNFVPGSISNSTGNDNNDEGYLRTPFIPIENDKFTLYTDMAISSSIRTFVYDADKNWISTANEVGFYRIQNGEKADVTKEAKYIKCRVGSTDTSGTLTVTFDENCAIHQKVYFNNGYNMESTLIEDNLYQLQVNAEEDEFNIFTIAAPKNNASESTISLMLNDENKTQFVDLSCMKYHEDEDGYFCTILQSRGDTPLPRYILGFNDGKGAGRVRKLEITPDAIPMQFVSDGIRVRKDNAYDNNWTDDNSTIINLAELAEKVPNWDSSEENAKAYIDTQLESKSDTNHTHNYAGANSVGGAAINSYKLDGYHADDFMFNYGNYGTVYFNSSDLNTWTRAGNYSIQSGCTNVPTERGEDVWGTLFVVKGLEDRISQYAIFWNENENPLWHRCLNGSTWSEWKRVRDNGNADTVDGFHAYEIQTKSNDGSLFTDENNTAFVQWDGSNYFWLKAPLNATAVNHSESSDITKGISSTGFGDTNLTYYQSGEEFYDRTGWCHYLIANHGSGESYYNYVIGLPFWSSPIYRRQDGNPDNRTEWHKFHTTETITYGTSSLVVGTAVLPEGHIYLQYE